MGNSIPIRHNDTHFEKTVRIDSVAIPHKDHGTVALYSK
jgi:hypothetical protein